jgi:Spy/CpxP family protein refolding chaperone
MTRKIFGAFALALVLVVGLVAARMVYAQAGGGMGGMMGMMSMMKDCPMMGAMSQRPQAALEHHEDLGLSETQVSRLQALAEQAAPNHSRAMQQMQPLHQEIRQATTGDQFNEAAARAALDRMGDLHTEMGVAMLRTQHQTRQILTAEQRSKLQEMGGGMMGMQGMGMMEDCPMMKGGMMGSGMMGSGMMNQGQGSSRQHHHQS